MFIPAMMRVIAMLFSVVVTVFTVVAMISVEDLGFLELVTLATHNEQGGEAHSKEQMTEKSHGIVFNREPEFLQLPTYSIR